MPGWLQSAGSDRGIFQLTRQNRFQRGRLCCEPASREEQAQAPPEFQPDAFLHLFSGFSGATASSQEKAVRDRTRELKEMLPPADEASASLWLTAAMVIPEDCCMGTGSSGNG